MPLERYDESLQATDGWFENPQLKKGDKVKLLEDHPECGAKAGDIVKVTCAKHLFSDETEQIRVSNGKFSWKVSSATIGPIAWV